MLTLAKSRQSMQISFHRKSSGAGLGTRSGILVWVININAIVSAIEEAMWICWLAMP